MSSDYSFTREKCTELPPGERMWGVLIGNCFSNCKSCVDGECKGEPIGSPLCEAQNDIFCENGIRWKCTSYCKRDKVIEICQSGKCANKRVLTPEQALDTKSPLPHSKLWGITINKDNCEPVVSSKDNLNSYSISDSKTYLPRQSNYFTYNGDAYQISSSLDFQKPLRMSLDTNMLIEPTVENTFTIQIENDEIEEGIFDCSITESSREEITLTPNEEIYNLFCFGNTCEISLNVLKGSVIQNTLIEIKKLKFGGCNTICGNYLCEIGETSQNCPDDCKKCYSDLNCRFYCQDNTVTIQGKCTKGVCTSWTSTGNVCADEKLEFTSKTFKGFISKYEKKDLDLKMLMFFTKYWVKSF